MLGPPALCGLVALAVLVCLAPTVSSTPAPDPVWHMYGLPHTAFPFQLYDPNRRRMLLVSSTDEAARMPVVWSCDLDSATTWMPLHASGQAPIHNDGTAYQLSGACVDPIGDRLIVWGSGGVYADDGTWTLSFQTLTWSQLLTSSAIGGVASASVYDPVGKRILSYAGIVQQLNLTGSPAWTDVAIANSPQPTSPSPPSRANPSLSFDSKRNRLLMYGGLNGGALDETWEVSFQGTPTWRFIPPAAPLPPGRYAHIAMVDSLADRMLVWGGANAPFNDVWALDLSVQDTCRWTHLSSNPGIRPVSTVIFDPVKRNIVGGGGFLQADPDTTSFIDSIGGRFEMNVDGSPVWLATRADVLVPMNSGLTAYDAARQRIVTVGPNTQQNLNMVVWAADLNQPPTWQRLSIFGTWPHNASLIADTKHDRLVLFGGTTAAETNDVLSFDLATNVWTTLTPSGTPPDARQGHTAVYDSAGDRMIVYGGYNPASARPYYGDVWALALSGTPSWTRLDSPGLPAPARAYHAAAFDRGGSRLIVTGGRDTLGYHADTWSFSLDSLKWTLITPSGGPRPNEIHWSACFDDKRQRMLVPQEVAYPGSGVELVALTMANPPAWTSFVVPGLAPEFPAVVQCAFDGAGDRLLLGRVETGGLTHGEFWTLQFFDSTATIEVSLVGFTADTSSVHLTWQLTGVTGSVAIERQADGGSWGQVATQAPDGSGRLTYDDLAVQPGHHYDYRLIVPGLATPQGLASVQVPGPGGPTLFLALGVPGTSAAFRVTVPPGTVGARVELFDLTGRRVAVRPVEPLSPVVDFGRSATRPGVYLARLVVRGVVLSTTRAVVLE